MANPPVLERRSYSKGKIIVREGEDAFVAFIIQSGKIRVYQEKDGHKVELSVLGAGEIFGELALLQDSKRTASVEAIEDCNMIVITRDVFRQKLEKTDPTIRAVVDMLAKRVTKSNTELVKAKGVNVNSFLALLNQLFRDLADMMEEEDRSAFRTEAYPVMKELTKVLEKYRDKL